MGEQKIREWVELALKDEDIDNYIINIQGTSKKDEGYLGNIFFVNVTGRTKCGQDKTLNLVIKASKTSKTLRQQTPIRQAFKKEIFVYSRILQTFKNFQEEMGATNVIDFLPKCYFTEITSTSELLVFEDLKSQGFSTWDRQVPMTLQHLKLVLQAYGKWHAFSFALRKEKPEIFEELTRNNVNVLCYWFEKTKMIDLTLDLFDKARDGCIFSNNEEIVSNVTFSKKDAHYIFKELFDEDANYRVMSHGDCWNNNFMFKYKIDTLEPVSVQILDWQCAGFSSPVMDLSHFLYACCNTEKQKDVSELLKIYYGSFSQCLKSLDCEPDELFPYSKLVEHWKRFSRYGILLQGFLLKFTLCDAKDAPDFAEAAEQGKEFVENFNIEVSNEELYYKRARDNLEHYVHNLKLSEEY